ncbi:serine/threonine-protein phosphatase 4 regulatory subunit 2 [Chelonus insularis]|uniref:serine/threonine-protein phosphatase 4 regulatory subunit 2 n=1 Tax=Chelonus insularis TaxID=460826 RepID=UPI00158D89D3|nr:serine/threonine-protein phosphatase 4 regulatory subunit 2 [Chelonus insularis]
MDNPEEVLQALDEFSKMRPSEIPRELEDYLCFVAKTGDPVYQWSLIKPLFREKLVKVMTDFYENCPALDLASSPNLEHFNYDIMKCNLLELLESFPSAPFTVQRICELLTAPRKQYNRVDKFMRAIEKNILVVSTKEPGLAARRNENGDSMINGSIDEETPNTESAHEVEMESWVKDCTTESTVSLPSVENDVPLVETVLPSNKLSKNANTDENLSVINDKDQSTSSRLDISVSNFIAAHEMSNSPVLSTPPVETSILCNSNIVNANSEEVSGIVNEVPEAIINEDTSSQPSLESENDESENNSGRKLQTTFQSKDFGKVEEKSSSYYPEINNVKENLTHNDIEANKEDQEKIHPNEKEIDCSVDNNLELETPEKRVKLDNNVSEPIEKEDSENYSSIECNNEESLVVDESINSSTKQLNDDIDKNCNEPSVSECKVNDTQIENPAENISENVSTSSSDSETLKESNEESTEDFSLSSSADDIPKPIVEEPVIEPFNENSHENSKSDEHSSNVIIEEAMDDDTKFNNTLVPDPIPIIEEPRDDTSTTTTVMNKIDSCPKNEEEPQLLEENNIENTSGENLEVKNDNLKNEISSEHSETTSITPMEKDEPTESMDVDNEEVMPVFQQDEPMEEESGELRS